MWAGDAHLYNDSARHSKVILCGAFVAETTVVAYKVSLKKVVEITDPEYINLSISRYRYDTVT